MEMEMIVLMAMLLVKTSAKRWNTHELLIKSENVQVALPDQPLLLELLGLLQPLLYRCDQN